MKTWLQRARDCEYLAYDAGKVDACAAYNRAADAFDLARILREQGRPTAAARAHRRGLKEFSAGQAAETLEKI